MNANAAHHLNYKLYSILEIQIKLSHIFYNMNNDYQQRSGQLVLKNENLPHTNA